MSLLLYLYAPSLSFTVQLPIQIFVGQALVKIDCPSLLRTPEDSLNMDLLYFNIIYLLYVLKYIHSNSKKGEMIPHTDLDKAIMDKKPLNQL